MTEIFPKDTELYTAVINDCYNMMYELQKSKDNNFKKEAIKLENKKVKIKDMINIVKSYIDGNKSNNKTYSVIISFSLLYINKISELYSKEVIQDMNIKFTDSYIFAYIALSGFRCNLFNYLENEEFFKFELKYYENYAKFLNEYTLVSQIKTNFVYYSTPIINSINTDDDIYFDIIKKFDEVKQFYPQLIDAKNYKINDYFEVIKEGDLDSTRENSINKEKNNEKKNDITQQKDENSNLSISRAILNKIVRKNNSNDEHDKQTYESTTNNNQVLLNNITEINTNNNELANNNNSQTRDEQDVNERIDNLELIMNSLKIDNENLNHKSIKSDFENIKLNFKILEIEEKSNYESIFNSVLVNIEKTKINYLENYIESLKNSIINLSNPYNMNFWRKISNIILKNIFVILKNNNFTINQSKDESTLKQLKDYFDDMKTKNNKIRNKIQANLIKYENYLKDEILSKESSGSSADKERNFNLITIYHQVVN